jgi:hypothetical protein
MRITEIIIHNLIWGKGKLIIDIQIIDFQSLYKTNPYEGAKALSYYLWQSTLPKIKKAF